MNSNLHPEEIVFEGSSLTGEDVQESFFDPNFDPIVEQVHNIASSRPPAITSFGCWPEVDPETSAQGGVTIEQALEFIENSKMGFVCTSVLNQKEQVEEANQQKILSVVAKHKMENTETLLKTSDWTNRVFHVASDCFLKVLASEKSTWQELKWAEKNLKQEFDFCEHLSIRNIILSVPSNISGKRIGNFGRILSDVLCKMYPFLAIWYVVKFETENGDSTNIDSFLQYHQLAVLCRNSPLFGAVLEMPSNLPEHAINWRKWYGENMFGAILPTRIFTTDANGSPSLSPAHIDYLFEIFDHSKQILFSGVPFEEEGFDPFAEFVTNLSKMRPLKSYVDDFSHGYEDLLQIPLQPLYDNLSSQTYEIFEKDPVKYGLYEDAIRMALIDLRNSNKTEVNVFVVGAGRGPLVKAAFRAAKKIENLKVNLAAIEKNPNALMVLHHFNKNIWGGKVRIIGCDMRDITFNNEDEKADILVSELLGSLGDNELSPECLDGACKKLLKKDGGISIPVSYTSFLSPVNCYKAYTAISARSGNQNPSPQTGYDMAYIIKLFEACRMSDIRKVFTFSHPNPSNFAEKTAECENVIEVLNENDNSRFESLEFKIGQDCEIHGFIGYFDCVLYKNVRMSINPETMSKGLFSWYPIFFPISEAVLLHNGDKLVLDFWRIQTNTKVWYEWCLTSPITTRIHNKNGDVYNIKSL